MAYSAITDAELGVNKPITTSLMFRMRDNPEAIFAQLGWLVTGSVYISPEQTIVASGPLTLNHGLTIADARTIDYELYLVNQVGEFGYSPGDIVIPIMDANNAVGKMSWPGIILTTSQLIMRYGSSPFTVTNHTSGNASVITAASWKMVIKARG